MAGLLAWAADVVGVGPSDSTEDNSHEHQTFQIDPMLLSYQLRHDLSTLDAKTAALQQTVDSLRQRVGPGAQGFAERMPHLLADSIASQAALNLEVQAHNTTRLQLQVRQDSLRAENEAYAKALAARKEGSKERGREGDELQSSLKDLEEKERILRSEFEELEAAVSKKDGLAFQEEEETAATAADRDSHSLHELKQLRAESDAWEANVAKLDKELTTARQSALRWPSPVQREKELERRLRNLTEQLVTKQVQAETVANERNALEIRLHELNKACDELLASGNFDGNLKRNKIGGRSSTSLASGEEPRLRGWHVRHQTPKAMSENVAKVARTVDSFSLHAGSHLWRNKVLRSLTVAYILGLHIAAFVILTRRMHRQFRPSIRELP